MNKFFGIELERSESFYVASLELQTVAHIAINHGSLSGSVYLNINDDPDFTPFLIHISGALKTFKRFRNTNAHVRS